MKTYLRKLSYFLVGFYFIAFAPLSAAIEQDVKTSIIVWASSGPLAYLSGAEVTVKNASGKVVGSGKTQRRGTLILRLDQKIIQEGPLQIAVTGGIANDKPFRGHLLAEAYAVDGKFPVIHVDILSTVASRLKLTGYSYSEGMVAARRVFNISKGAPVDVLRTRNNHVDLGLLQSSEVKDGGIDAIIQRIANAARANLKIVDFSPVSPSYIMKQSGAVLTTPTAPTYSAALPGSAASICSTPSGNGNAEGNILSSNNVADYGEVIVGSLFEEAGVPTSLNNAITGMLLSAVGGSKTTSPDQAAIENVSLQLDCISTQIASLSDQVIQTDLDVAIQSASACNSALSADWDYYQAIVNNALQNPNDQEKQLNASNPTLLEYLPLWKQLKVTCGAAIDDTLFGTSGGQPSYWQNLNKKYQTDYNWYTAMQVQQLQSILGYWSTKIYQQFVLYNEYDNFYGLWDVAQIESGAASNGSTGCKYGTTNDDHNFCVYMSHFANAFPGNLYSDEIGIINSGTSVSAYPAGITLPSQSASSFNGDYLGTQYLSNHAPYNASTLASTIKTIVNNNVPASPGSSAVENYNSPQLPRTMTIAASQIDALKSQGPNGISMTQFFYNSIDSNGTWSNHGITAQGAGFYTSDDTTTGSISDSNGATYVILNFGTFNDLPQIGVICTTTSCLGGEKSVLSVLLGRTWWSGSASAMYYIPPEPLTVTNSPTLLGIESGAGKITLSVIPPTVVPNGTTLLGYKVACSAPNEVTVTTTSPPDPNSSGITAIVVSYLTGGVTYSCSAQAQNSQGYSDSSSSLSETPSSIAPSVPNAPVLISAVPGADQITLVFNVPAYQGSSPVTGYLASCISTQNTYSKAGNTSPVIVTNLVAGDSYTCSVTAQNAVGTSVNSNLLSAISSGFPSVPGAPTLSKISWGNGGLLVMFSQPDNTGYLPITGNLGTCISKSTSQAYYGTWPPEGNIFVPVVEVDNTNDIYNCYVQSQNSMGYGPKSNTLTFPSN